MTAVVCDRDVYPERTDCSLIPSFRVDTANNGLPSMVWMSSMVATLSKVAAFLIVATLYISSHLCGPSL